MTIAVALSPIFAHCAAAATTPFGIATMAAKVTHVESSVFMHAVSAPGNHGVLTSIFIESADLLWQDYDLLRLRVYIDGEADPSIDVPMGFFDKGLLSPWGETALGNTGSLGAEYIRVPMPFGKSIKVALVLGPGDLGPHKCNLFVQGTEAVGAAPFRMVTQNFNTAPRKLTPGENATFFDSATIVAANSATSVAPFLVGFNVQGQDKSFYTGGAMPNNSSSTKSPTF